MEANKFYSVPYDGHNWADVRMLARILKRDRFEVYGRWHAFLGVLYQAGGLIELTANWRGMLMEDLGLDGDGLDEWLEACAQVDFIDAESLHARNVAASNGVCKSLQKKIENSDKARNMAKARWDKQKSKE